MEDKKNIIRDKYGEIAQSNSGCGCSCCGGGGSEEISKQVGYSEEEIQQGEGANMGLGCGNPLAIGDIAEGEAVVDLGSGGGFDCFLASQKVGEKGKVIGVDMTQEMVDKARENAKQKGINNVEFLLGEIEELPLEDASVDAVISNCVINLSPDKDKVFSEIHRVLNRGGRMYISDIVLLEELSEEQKNDEDLLVGCVAGAIMKEEYLEKIKKAGFEIEETRENKDISKEQYGGINLESLTIKAVKN
jgi:ubiquinone/menaquinone biosynthesis C-methylase UbiE